MLEGSNEVRCGDIVYMPPIELRTVVGPALRARRSFYCLTETSAWYNMWDYLHNVYRAVSRELQSDLFVLVTLINWLIDKNFDIVIYDLLMPHFSLFYRYQYSILSVTYILSYREPRPKCPLRYTISGLQFHVRLNKNLFDETVEYLSKIF